MMLVFLGTVLVVPTALAEGTEEDPCTPGPECEPCEEGDPTCVYTHCRPLHQPDWVPCVESGLAMIASSYRFKALELSYMLAG